jgi:hypothetical protein
VPAPHVPAPSVPALDRAGSTEYRLVGMNVDGQELLHRVAVVPAGLYVGPEGPRNDVAWEEAMSTPVHPSGPLVIAAPGAVPGEVNLLGLALTEDLRWRAIARSYESIAPGGPAGPGRSVPVSAAGPAGPATTRQGRQPPGTGRRDMPRTSGRAREPSGDHSPPAPV